MSHEVTKTLFFPTEPYQFATKCCFSFKRIVNTLHIFTCFSDSVQYSFCSTFCGEPILHISLSNSLASTDLHHVFLVSCLRVNMGWNWPCHGTAKMAAHSGFDRRHNLCLVPFWSYTIIYFKIYFHFIRSFYFHFIGGLDKEVLRSVANAFGSSEEAQLDRQILHRKQNCTDVLHKDS